MGTDGRALLSASPPCLTGLQLDWCVDGDLLQWALQLPLWTPFIQTQGDFLARLKAELMLQI